MSGFFAGTRPGRVVTCGTARFDLPILYFRDDFFTAFFTVDLERARALLPSPRLHPISVGGGRALLAIAAFDYLQTTVGPYGEVGVALPVVHGRRPPPWLPALLESRWPGFGALILHLPVTRRLARDAGRGVWGYTKFVADMAFANTPEYHECKLDEDGEHILTLRVAKGGLPLPERRPMITYSVKDRTLIRTVIPQRGLARVSFGTGSRLVLGERHPVALELRALGLDPRPRLTRYFVERNAILPEGEVVETGVQPLDGHRGVERDEGVVSAVHLEA